jgi:hypothetical protein
MAYAMPLGIAWRPGDEDMSSFLPLSIDCALGIMERFQTILVGFLGFAGVMLTLWYNARAARRQSERVLGNEQASICAALHAELTIHREALQKAVADFAITKESGVDKTLVIPIDPMSSVYDALLPRIGVLSSRKVQAVMYAYLTADTLLKSVILLGKRDGDHALVNARHVGELTKMFASVLPYFDEAIREVAPISEKNRSSGEM